jgi:hypothetical protein
MVIANIIRTVVNLRTATMEEPLVEDNNNNVTSTTEEHHSSALPPTTTPAGVKICAVLSVFVVGIALGGAGHTVYTTYWDKMNPEDMSAAGALLARIDLNASMCTSPWNYVCNNYIKKNYVANSFIMEVQLPQFIRALDAFEQDRDLVPVNSPARTFYNQCKESGPVQNSSACSTAYNSEMTLVDLWKAGAIHSGLTVGRTASPYRRGFRSLVVLCEETVNFVEYPTVITSENDNCNLMMLAKMLASVDNNEIMVYGKLSEVCIRWNDLRSSANAVNGARRLAAKHCKTSVQRLQTPLDCFLETAKYWPQTNLPYMKVIGTEKVDTVLQRWFEEVKSTILQIAAPLGKKVLAKLAAVSVEVGWSSQNLGSGPSNALIGISTAESVIALRAWAMQQDLTATVHVFPRFAMSAYAINAYYTSAENKVYLPAGLFSLSSALRGETLGQLASIIAHEIWHSVDPSSIKYNEHGAPSHLMSASVETTYNALVDCIKTSDDTIAEDFADYQAVSTIQMMAAKESNDHVISTTKVSYDTHDIALISFAAFWCTSKGPTIFNTTPQISRDPHSLPQFRVEHSLTGAADKQFDCKSVAPRCTLLK